MWANYSAQLGLCWKGQDQSGVHVASAAPGRSANPWLVLPGYSMMSEKKKTERKSHKTCPPERNECVSWKSAGGERLQTGGWRLKRSCSSQGGGFRGFLGNTQQQISLDREAGLSRGNKTRCSHSPEPSRRHRNSKLTPSAWSVPGRTLCASL